MSSLATSFGIQLYCGYKWFVNYLWDGNSSSPVDQSAPAIKARKKQEYKLDQDLYDSEEDTDFDSDDVYDNLGERADRGRDGFFFDQSGSSSSSGSEVEVENHAGAITSSDGHGLYPSGRARDEIV
ncbi:unnamed protein product [Amoebophrya sp. A120]|nr:unnamed protein product [Amoebophrya sp. A120]|eukprot:GSA120T00013947001.1